MKTSRRFVLKMGPALAAAAWAAPTSAATGATAPEASTGRDSSFDPWVEIRGDHLRHNVTEIHRRVSSRPILAVIKNNGYGAGITHVARTLEPSEPIAGFAVVKLHEAMTLRDAGIRKTILLMGPFDEKNLEDVVARGITPMVYRPMGDMLDRVAAKLDKKIPIHICVDTGIGRVGVPYWQAAELIRDLAGRDSVTIEGTMMTFTEDPDFDKEQFRRFQTLCSSLESEGIRLGSKHAASSYGLFLRPEAFLDMVRPGMAIFGVYSEKEFRGIGVMELRPALSLKARVIYVKKLRKGDGAGYNRAYVADKDVWVATLPVGHGDGFPRVGVKGARVRIGSELYRLIGTVSASHSIVELGSEPRVSVGDVATFFDWQDGSRPEDVGAACGASVYDLYMHLNPLLPKKTI